MIVHFYATLRTVVGKREVDIPLPEFAAVWQLVDEIVAQYPALRQEIVDKKGNLQNHIHIFVNGRDIVYMENGIDSVLSPGDVISIFPPVGGG
jgi:molybdopterin synthase sulfur carrier subunit